MGKIYTKELTFLSNYSWDNPNVLELLCETASYREKRIRHFSKPQSIFKEIIKVSKESYINFIDSRPLFNFSIKFSKIPILNIIQEKFIWNQVYGKKKENEFKVLIYNNLDSLYNLKKYFYGNFDLLIYLCEDYSDLNKRLIDNCEIADCILIIPKSMVKVIKKEFPDKKIIHWPQPVTNISLYDLSNKDKRMVDQILSNIPKPRIIYSGHGLDRLDKDIFYKASQILKNCSFIYFGDKSNINGENIFQLPSFTKHQMKYIISRSQVGFMPYDTSDLHNFHCVPLKLFDYFSEGLPVVSSKLVNVIEYQHLIYMCKSVDQFIVSLKKALNESVDSKNRLQRKNIFEYHSTYARCDDFNSAINELLHIKINGL